jgi:predicted nucleic acid-binding protein
MNGLRVVADTNSLIYLLNGNPKVGTLLDGKECWISVITELELYGKKNLTPSDKKEIQILIDSCFVVDLEPGIKQIVKYLQQSITLKLPDVIIAATALYLNLPLLTADKAFLKVNDLELVLLDT